MGLDQYAAIRLDTKDEEGIWDTEELAYWRKHPHLQGFMENLYVEKGGTEEFNCVDVELTLEDIDALEASVKGDELPETGGFFFGDVKHQAAVSALGNLVFELKFKAVVLFFGNDISCAFAGSHECPFFDLPAITDRVFFEVAPFV